MWGVPSAGARKGAEVINRGGIGVAVAVGVGRFDTEIAIRREVVREPSLTATSNSYNPAPPKDNGRYAPWPSCNKEPSNLVLQPAITPGTDLVQVNL